MSLDRVLRTIRALPDLRQLVRAFGLTPRWDEVPPEAGPRTPGPRPRRVIVAVARVADFPWLATADSEPARTAHHLTRRLVARGRTSGVLVLDSRGRRLAVAAAFGNRPPVLEVDLDAPDPTAIASLTRLAAASHSGEPDGGTLGYAARVADALSAERVGQRFFLQFRATLGAMTAGLPGAIRGEDRHTFALLQLTRVLFLYFVQTKGWLDGRERFLADAVDHCLTRGRRVHRDLLRPLFFGTLNRPTGERGRTARAFGALPFLNGGLFEPHPLERRYRVDLPNPLWRDAFDDLFERFHFTVAERDRRGAVAPDMLGRVFEGVMDPEARRSSGTFYTPTALVTRLVDAGLVALVAQRFQCDPDDAARRLERGDPAVAALLDAMTILDPAVGSGAFLLGALERLAGFGGDGSAARKRRVLQRNLFGVDRNPTAVRLTELRLWLAVIADDTTGRPADVAPLPNLDCLVRQGDSLFDPMFVRGPQSVGDARPRAAELALLRQQVITAFGADKRRLVRQLRAAELELVAASLRAAEAQLDAEVASCMTDARAHDLFGRPRGLDRTLRAQLQQLRVARRETRRGRRLAAQGEVSWFHYQSHFADVFARSSGFDLVIGNPPWQRAETIPRPTRERLAGRYRWWRSGGGGYANRPDLAVAFLERAVELTSPGGATAMIVPAKLASAGYAAAARHALATETTLHIVADLRDDRDAEFDATVYPLAVIATKAAPPVRHRVRTSLARCKPTTAQASLMGGGPWLLVADRRGRALAALRADHPPLAERFACHLGLKTGANHLFLDPPADLEPEVIRPAVRGRDVGAFSVSAGVRLLWTHDAHGEPCRVLPPRAAAYLASHGALLRARADFAGGAPWTLFRTAAATARHRVIWPDLARRLTAAALAFGADRDCIPLNTCYVAPARSAAEAERLAAWLNSTWIRAAAVTEAVPASGGFARFNAAVVGRVPLPAAALRDDELVALARAGAGGADIQEELDAVAAAHLALSARDQAALRCLPSARSGDRR